MTTEPLADDLAPDEPATEVPPKPRVWRRPRFWIAFVLAAALVAGWSLTFYYQHSSETYRQADAKSRATASDLSKRLGSMTQERDTEKARADQLQTREDAVKQLEDRVQTREGEVKKREDAVSQAEKVQAQNTIHEGTWAVDVDIQPGTYRTKDPVSGQCYWAIYSDANGRNIVANDIVTGGRPTVTLSGGQYFTSRRCGDWTKVS
ncbi:coiled-coil domain-containing protein 22 [Planosporangium flavigriseum]|uniref:Uncharacterized protein n=1 Tax=Planosporangium flavigriseum TaxID=373681 RepID=A0A8J3LKS1_9ACTN|nr:coiled-coil domain-containing protein 22 [Planosporangium flavigriseum]NJC62936.1 coiled-coil domain-containing protein 22 [Planosporangium flavigriseum]GIG73199.1 hypothetical protein Pfl04_16030 [Planosporangium flavigriseum]